MNRIHALIAASFLTATGAFGQALNVDINIASGTGAGVPASTYAGASGQAGVWNSWLSSTVGATNLVGLNGSNSGVTCTKIAGSSTSSSVSGATTDYSRLVFDYMSTTGQGSKVGVTLNGLDAGLYRLFVHAAQPGTAGQWVDSFNATNYFESLVVVKVGASQAFSAFCGGAPVTANTFVRGDDYVVGTLVVGNGAPAVTIESSTGFTNNERSALNGFQLIKYTGSTLFVDISATGSNTGQNWANAFTNLQDALELARTSQGMITQIWVANGVYRPTNLSGTAARSATFALPDNCKVLGGFSGNETLVAQRDPAANPTYLSGNIGNIFTAADNSYHVVTADGVGAGAVLDGFNINGGNASVTQTINQSGGGMHIIDAAPMVRNCTFSSNSSVGYGGAVMIEGTNAPSFENCTFSSNTASWSGGGIYHEGPNGFLAPVLKVNGCTFVGNTASSSTGSGIAVGTGNAWIANSLFNGNSAGDGGAVASANQFGTGSAALYGCTITNNSAFVQSGGLYTAFTGSISVRNSIVWNNTSGNAWRGKQFEQFYPQPGTTITFTYSDVQSENRAGVTGTGNVNTNPDFVSLTGPNGIAGDSDDNLRLSAQSFLIDRGSNSAVPTDFTDADSDNDFAERSPFDLDGNARKIDDPNTPDGGVGPAPVVDIGCFEFSAPPVPPCPADFNQDGGV
ncbi:MAG: hypothetical protein NTV94_18290, partial [Planctomycetota bacterium]|nr:hypothetical protein [Planctomycetota bacterium]